MPSGWPSPAAMSAPYAPGGARTASETGSTTATNSAPAAWASRPISAIGSSRPKKFGWPATTPATGRSASAEQPLERREVGRARRPSPSATSGISSTSRPPSKYVAIVCAVVGMDRPRDEDPLAAGRPAGHQRGLGGRGRAVVVRGGDDVESDQLGDQRLVLVDALERALADLGLVRRVGRVPLAAQQQLVDRRRRPVAVDAGAQERGEVRPVAGGQALEAGRQLELRLRLRQVEAARPQRVRDVGEELVDARRCRGPRASARGRRRCAVRTASPAQPSAISAS